MKKIFLFLILLICVNGFTQVIIDKKIECYNFPSLDDCHYFFYFEKDTLEVKKEIYDNCKIGDIYRFSGEGQSQLDTNEIKDRMLKVQKEYKELYEQKVKALETSDLDLIHKQGQMIELSIQYEEAKKQK